jgi:hypothetical protein
MMRHIIWINSTYLLRRSEHCKRSDITEYLKRREYRKHNNTLIERIHLNHRILDEKCKLIIEINAICNSQCI